MRKLNPRAPRQPPQPFDYQLSDRLLPLEAIMQMVGLGRTMIYRKIREGTFPKPFKPGGASSRWSEGEVSQWLAEVRAARDAATMPNGNNWGFSSQSAIAP